MKSTDAAALTGDVIGSTAYGATERVTLGRALTGAFKDVETQFHDAWATGLSMRITAGDEFQGVLRDASVSFRALLYLRSAFACSMPGFLPMFRASIGVGAIAVMAGGTSWQQDGQAFARSRQGLDALAIGRSPVRWTSIVTGDLDTDASLAAVMVLCDHLQQRWTRGQWEAIRLALLGSTRQDIAQALGVKHQNVTKRLQAAGWPAVNAAAEYVERTLKHAATQPG